MILRRLRAHFEKENWFAVGIDFAIVVIGVFIGLQVANWNEARADRLRADRIKDRLIAEFQQIEDEAVRHANDISSWQVAVDQLAKDSLAGNVTPDDPDLPSRVSQVLNWRQPSGGSATYNELVSQGDMDLLTSYELREALLRFDVLAKRHIDANLLLVNSLYNSNSDIVFRLQSISSLPAEDRSEDFAAILERDLASPDFYFSMAKTSQAFRADLDWHRATRARACDVLEALSAPCNEITDVERGGQ